MTKTAAASPYMVLASEDRKEGTVVARTTGRTVVSGLPLSYAEQECDRLNQGGEER